MFRKLLTVVLALALLALPLAGLAESQTGYLSFTLRDPVFSVGEQKIDLTGLEMNYALAAAMLEDSSLDMTGTMRILANGEEALSAAAQTDMTKAAFLLSGMEKAMTIRFADLGKLAVTLMAASSETEPTEEQKAEAEAQVNASVEAALAGFRQSLAASMSKMDGKADIEAFQAFVEKFAPGYIDFIASKLASVEETETEIEFFGEKEYATCVKVTFTEEDFKTIQSLVFPAVFGENADQMIAEMNEQGAAATMDFSVYRSAGDVDARIFANVKSFKGGEHTTDVDFDVRLSHPAENTGKLAGDVTITEIASGETIIFSGTADATPSTFDASKVDIDADYAVTAGTETAMTGELTAKYVDATRQEVAFSLDVPAEEIHLAANLYTVRADDREFGISLSGTQSGAELFGCALTVKGQDAGKGEVFDFNGTLEAQLRAEGMAMNFATGFGILGDPSIEGRMLDLSSVETVDLATLSSDELATLLGSDLMMSVFGAVGTLQQLPGVADLISSMTAVEGEAVEAEVEPIEAEEVPAA